MVNYTKFLSFIVLKYSDISLIDDLYVVLCFCLCGHKQSRLRWSFLTGRGWSFKRGASDVNALHSFEKAEIWEQGSTRDPWRKTYIPSFGLFYITGTQCPNIAYILYIWRNRLFRTLRSSSFAFFATDADMSPTWFWSRIRSQQITKMMRNIVHVT